MHRDELLASPLAFMPPARLLDGLTPEEAARPITGVKHSIVEILAHMVYWQAWFLSRCTGVAAPMAEHAAEGWPAAAAGDWAPLREQLLEGLQRALELPENGRVDPPIEFPPLAEYTIGDAITHIAQHNAHHLGQIVILRQMLNLWPPPDGSYTW
ncbi:DinB family protein [Paludibaculum fermentans]|uniref:DinB family protein n=1 Tax=Paludibaculum fermentans TaxID=1473598 RepID=UPI003EBAFD79